MEPALPQALEDALAPYLRGYNRDTWYNARMYQDRILEALEALYAQDPQACIERGCPHVCEALAPFPDVPRRAVSPTDEAPWHGQLVVLVMVLTGDWEHDFGEARSALEAPWTLARQIELFSLLDVMYAMYPERCVWQLCPYVEASVRDRPVPERRLIGTSFGSLMESSWEERTWHEHVPSLVWMACNLSPAAPGDPHLAQRRARWEATPSFELCADFHPTRDDDWAIQTAPDVTYEGWDPFITRIRALDLTLDVETLEYEDIDGMWSDFVHFVRAHKGRWNVRHVSASWTGMAPSKWKALLDAGMFDETETLSVMGNATWDASCILPLASILSYEFDIQTLTPTKVAEPIVDVSGTGLGFDGLAKLLSAPDLRPGADVLAFWLEGRAEGTLASSTPTAAAALTLGDEVSHPPPSVLPDGWLSDVIWLFEHTDLSPLKTLTLGPLDAEPLALWEAILTRLTGLEELRVWGTRAILVGLERLLEAHTPLALRTLRLAVYDPATSYGLIAMEEGALDAGLQERLLASPALPHLTEIDLGHPFHWY